MSSPSRVTHLLGYKIKRTQHALRLHMDEALRSINLTTPQYSVLAQLELRPGISNADLARASYITAQTMHSIISLLEKNNLIRREQDPCHGRILRTQLTEQGKRVVREAHAIIQRVEEKMTLSMSHDDKATFEKLLIDCFNNLNKSSILEEGV